MIFGCGYQTCKCVRILVTWEFDFLHCQVVSQVNNYFFIFFFLSNSYNYSIICIGEFTYLLWTRTKLKNLSEFFFLWLKFYCLKLTADNHSDYGRISIFVSVTFKNYLDLSNLKLLHKLLKTMLIENVLQYPSSCMATQLQNSWYMLYQFIFIFISNFLVYFSLYFENIFFKLEIIWMFLLNWFQNMHYDLND